MNSSIANRRRSSPLSMVPWFPRELFDIDGVFDSLVSNRGEQNSDSLAARLDLVETSQAFEIHMDLPGIKPEDVEIQFENNTLTIRGERKEEKSEASEDKQFHRVERRYGSFTRSVLLPQTVNDSEAVAEFENGVLKITLPKHEQAKPRKINIR